MCAIERRFARDLLIPPHIQDVRPLDKAFGMLDH
jgi:hypothetical protein